MYRVVIGELIHTCMDALLLWSPLTFRLPFAAA